MSCSQTQTIISFLFFLKPLSITILSENILFFSTSFLLCVLEQWDILPIFSTSLLSPSNTAPSKISFHLSILWFGCMKKHFTGLFFLSFVCLFFLNISRDQTQMFISKNFKDWFTHTNNSYSFLSSHYLKQMVEEGWTLAGCFPRGKQLPLVTAGQMSISDSQNTYFI